MGELQKIGGITKKHTYSIPFEGSTFTRTTSNTYNFVVAVRRKTKDVWVAGYWSTRTDLCSKYIGRMKAVYPEGEFRTVTIDQATHILPGKSKTTA